MATAGALNAPARRTAFGDVSNTARSRVADPAGKGGPKTRVKPVAAAISSREIRLEDKENKVLLMGDRVITNLKTTGTCRTYIYAPASSRTVAQTTSKAVPRGTSLNQQQLGTSLAQPPLRNGAPKNTTTIYSDRPEQKASVGSEASPVDDVAALVVKPVKDPRHYKSQPVLRAEQHSLRHNQSKFMAKKDNQPVLEDEDDFDDDVTDAAYEDAVERLAQDVEGALYEARNIAEEASQRQFSYAEFDAAQSTHPLDRSRLPKALPDLPVAVEQDEYWDEEDEQDLYDDEQGYTTAHSYRSHGDNTTGGPTTLLAPDITANVQKELDMARKYVLAHQTEEEIEEEQWDVSMVAEYGDEIFSYMQELEVCTGLL